MSFEITQEEKEFILKRRELSARRKKLRHSVGNRPAPANQAQPKNAAAGVNRPQGWDYHADLSKPHAGRVTEEHPLFKFEDEIFKKISNLQHKDQHKLIRKLFNVPVQNIFRDRAYHILTHLDTLWEQEMLPLKYKIWYEELKANNGIGDTNVHEEHKKLKEEYTFPSIGKKRPWDVSKYSCEDPAAEEFSPGKKYRYDYDNEAGYKFQDAYKKELSA